MVSLERSSVWRNLSLAMRQITPWADGRQVGPEDRQRVSEALQVIGVAIRSLAKQRLLTRSEVRLMESEAGRIRMRMETDAEPARAQTGFMRPAPNPQASYDRLNRLIPVLRQVAETGECSKPVLGCVEKGLELDLALLGDSRYLEQVAEPHRTRVDSVVREVKRQLQTLRVTLEIQSFSA